MTLPKTNNGSNNDSITIPKRMMLGIAPAVAIIGVLLSTDRTPQVFLFLIGIAAGIIIGSAIQSKPK